MPSDSDEPRSDVDATIWTLIEAAAGGSDARRAEFAERYLPLVRRYLAERWRGSRRLEQLDDATQEVFVECLRAGGVLERADAGRPGGFRAFLLGAVRNVARRHESGRGAGPSLASTGDASTGTAPTGAAASDAAAVEALERTLEREWARCLVRQAAEHHRRTALARGAAAREGVELLRLRFEEDLPIRAIAARWGADPARLHRRYRQAREEFRRSLRRVVAFHHPGAPDVDAECVRLLALLGAD